MTSADRLLDDFCNCLANRPWMTCVAICAACLMAGKLETMLP